MTLEAYRGAMTSEAPEARIRLFMDALIAEYNALCTRWQLLQNAGLGIAVLAVFGFAAGELEPGRTAAIVATGVACIAWAGHVLERERSTSSVASSNSQTNSKG